MSNVIHLYQSGSPDNVLDQAAGAYKEVLVIGFDRDGELDFRCSSNMTNERANWLLDITKTKIVTGNE